MKITITNKNMDMYTSLLVSYQYEVIRNLQRLKITTACPVSSRAESDQNIAAVVRAEKHKYEIP